MKNQEEKERARESKNREFSYWINRLSLFLYCYLIISYFGAMFTNTGNPYFWTLFVMFPAIGIYLIFKWLWSR